MDRFIVKITDNNFKESTYTIAADNSSEAQAKAVDCFRAVFPSSSVIYLTITETKVKNPPFKVGDKVKCVATYEELEKISAHSFKYSEDEYFIVSDCEYNTAHGHYHIELKNECLIFDDFMFRKIENSKKEMTIAEIEAELGYSIKVVKEKE